MAIMFTGFQSGTIAAYLLSPAIMDCFGGDWRELFYVYGSFGVLLLLPWLLLAKDSPDAPLLPPVADKNSIVLVESREDKNEGVTTMLLAMKETNIASLTLQPQSKTSAATTSTWETSTRIFRDAPWRDFAKSPGVWAMLLAHCSKNWGLYNTLAWTPTFYAEQYGIGVRDSAWLSVLPSVAGAAGGLLAGNLADALIRYYSSRGEMNELTLTNVRKLFQSVALFGPALALVIMAMDIPADPVVAQCFLMVAVGLQAFTASGFESGNQEKAGEKWAGLLYSVTSLPAVMVGTAGVYTVGQILDATGQDWSIVFGINAIVNILGGTAFVALYNSKREFD
jgi:MFS transporter, ACS family, solute carrier family 17 (sodium-dependent inorganic phosphate cotransporter), other